MIEVRKATPADYEAYLALADHVFQGVGADIRFSEDLPKAYAPEADTAHCQRLVLEDGVPKALIAVLPGELHTPCGVLFTGYVGTVSVHPEARGRGYMKRLMSDWITCERARGCDLMMLGGQRQRYGYFGFAQGGECYTFTLSRSSIRHALAQTDPSKVEFQEIEPGSCEERAADTLRKSRLMYYGRDWCGFTVACRSYRHTPVAAIESGKLIGYLVMKQGEPQQLCECFALDNDALGRMLKAWQQLHGFHDCEVQIPVWDRQALRYLRTWAEDTALTPCLMLRVLNYPRVVATLLQTKAKWTSLIDGEEAFSMEGQRFTVRVHTNTVTVCEGGAAAVDLGASEAAALLFDPFSAPGREKTRNWFPLPISCHEPDNF